MQPGDSQRPPRLTTYTICYNLPRYTERPASSMPSTDSQQTRAAEKILKRVKHLRDHMQPGEIPLLAIPAIWDSGREQRSVLCEVIVTNRRLIGYYAVDFPRKRSFLEERSLSTITSVTLRHKTYEPLFRELMVRDGQSKLYVRASRPKIEALYATLRSAIDQYLPVARISSPPFQARRWRSLYSSWAASRWKLLPLYSGR